MWQDLKIDIGLFDSGRGGFSLLSQIIERLPKLRYGYIADDKYAPYGEKTEEEIIERSRALTRELKERGARMIVVACNSATAHAINLLREEFPELIFVGIEPYINALHKENLKESDRIVVITTVTTGKSKRFQELKNRIDPKNVIIHVPLRNLAKLVEEAFEKKGEDYEERLAQELENVKIEHPSHIILGCTHYPLIREKIEQLTGAKTIAPCQNVAQRVVALSSTLSLGLEEDPHSFWYMRTSDGEWKRAPRTHLSPKN